MPRIRPDNNIVAFARRALSEAIIEVRDAQAYVDKVRTAQNRLSSRIHAAIGAVEDAEAKLYKVSTDHLAKPLWMPC